MTDFIVENWAELLIAAAAFAKAVFNLIPTDKPSHDVFALVDKVITAITGDRRKPDTLPDDFDLQ